jgi:hypothetical protein
MILRPTGRALWWLLRRSAGLSWLIFARSADGAVWTSVGATRGVPPRVARERAERRLLLIILLAGIVATWWLLFELAGRLGWHGGRTDVITCAIAIWLVSTGTAGAWSKWLRSPGGRTWQLERELENPTRNGYRTPHSVRRVRLP